MLPARRHKNSTRPKERKPQDQRSRCRTGSDAPSKRCGWCKRPFSKSPKISWAQWDAQAFCSRSCSQHMPTEDRLMARIARVDGGCWEWTGPKDKDGYGTIALVTEGMRRTYRTHRVAYQIWRGPVPDQAVVMHACDNPRCINPDHLRVGTHADNMADKMSRGRHRNQYGAC